jgi:2-(1,2-epoxy-1,2-dihydrophenyl)acetyl-CoA isomerase
MSDVLFDKRPSGVALITLNRPDSLNAMGGELMPLLAQHLRECASDPEVRCVVLTGAGRAFCAGGDVKAMAAGGEILRGAGASGNGKPVSASGLLARSVEGLRKSQRDTSYQLHTMPKVTIAMINGHAVGAGLSLALACDIRIASDKAKIGTAFRNVGFSGDFGGSYFMTKIAGIETARYMYFTGEVVDAERAHSLSLVSKVVPHDDLEAETMKVADHIAAGPTLAYSRMKENLNRAETCDLATALDAEAMNMILSGQTKDHMEAAKAFVEKRQPTFVGE